MNIIYSLLFLSLLFSLSVSSAPSAVHKKKISHKSINIIRSNLFETWSFGFEIIIHSRGWKIPESLEQSQSKIQNPKSKIA